MFVKGEGIMFKGYYIKSKVRFSVFVSLMIIILGLSFSALFNISGVYADGKGAKTVTYYAITVEAGDTLWTIAEEYSDGKTDIRKLIYEISNLNNLETSNISVGQKLLIPA